MTGRRTVIRLALAACLAGGCLAGCGRRKRAQPLATAELVGTYSTVRPKLKAKLEIKENGTYRLTGWEDGAGEPTYTGPWEKWSLKSPEPEGFWGSIALYKIRFENWWDVEEAGARRRILDLNECLIEKYSDGQIRILISGRPDYWRRVKDSSGK